MSKLLLTTIAISALLASAATPPPAVRFTPHGTITHPAPLHPAR